MRERRRARQSRPAKPAFRGRRPPVSRPCVRPCRAKPAGAAIEKLTGAHELLALVNDILDISRIEASVIKIETIPFGLRELVDNLKALIDVQLADKDVVFEVEIAAGLPDRWIGDPGRLHQILINHHSNAAKFTAQGHIRLRVEAISRQSNVTVRFSVTDSGMAIGDKMLRIERLPLLQAA